jgi:Stage II sporulation protein M
VSREKSEINSIASLVIRALSRARVPILTIALTYFISVVLGIVMVHTGNAFALSYGDKIVSNAQSSPILVALYQNNRLQAAALDFAGNLFGAIANTIAGLGVVVSYPIVAYRGWIGGIVSVDGAHISRLADSKEATYYLVTLVLQLVPYSVSGGAGVNLGLAFLRPKSYYQGDKWMGIPKDAIRDTLSIYIVVVPLFLLASMWEFFAR